LTAGFVFLAAGCNGPKKGPIADDGHKRPVQRATLTAENNPTMLSGRGQPDLDDWLRPAAWIYVDGRSGEFLEVEGSPQGQWTITKPVSSTPTFRVEAYAPLLGNPRDFNCVLQPVDVSSDSTVTYVFSAVKGTFNVGHEYSLLKPGKNFTIRNYSTGDVVLKIPPLSPGTYLLAAGVKNLQQAKEGHAVTYFTVR
jgi:hypothetical protein